MLGPATSVPASVPARATDELLAIVRLAGPLVLTNLGHMALGLVDTAIVGRLGGVAIASAGLGNAVFFTVTLFGLGVLFGLDPLLSQATGANEDDAVDRAFAGGLQLALALAVPLGVLIAAIAVVVPWMGVPPETVEPTQLYLWSRVPSLVPFLLLNALRPYLQARATPGPLVLGVVIANLVNLPLAWVLCLGVGDWPGLGVLGAGLAAGLASAVQFAVSVAPVVRTRLLRDLRRIQREPARRAFALGWPLGLQIVAEAGSFSVVTFLVGRFGTLALSGHQLALMLVGCTFQLALGIGSATSVRVGLAVGQGTSPRRAGLVGTALGASVMLLGAIALWVMPRTLLGWLTSEPDVIDAGVGFLVVAAVFQLADGAQVCAQAALRGIGDTRFPFVANLVGHWLVGLPVGVGLAFGLGLGPVGLWWGLAVGLAIVAVSATVRFALEARGTVARVQH